MNKIQKEIKEFYLKKQADRQAKLRQDFLPEVLEIMEKPVSPIGHCMVIVVAVIILFFVAWAFLGKMDEIVTARGRIVTVSGTQNVQAANSGIVEEICVVEGEYVTAGQPIVIIDSAVNELTLQNTAEELALLELENELLLEISEGKNIEYRLEEEDDAEKIKVIKYVIAIQKEFQLQKEELDSTVEQSALQVATEEETLEKLKVNVEFLTNQKENIAAALDYANTAQQNAEKLALEIQYMEEELADYQELYNAGAVSKSEVEAVELELAQLRVDYEIQKNQTVYEEYDNNLQSGDIDNQLALAQKDVATQENVVLLAKEQYELALDGMEALEAEFATNISGLIVENENQISTLKTNLEIQTISVEQQTIVSPVDGIVKTLDINTVGGVLTMGQVVATVVPDDSQMMVEVDVLNQDIGCIQTGQSVVMKLDAFNFQEYGKLEGVIAFVGPDAVFDERKGWVYKVKIAIDDAAFVENNPEIQIGVGMECTTEIKVGERKIIEFFMEPIVEHFDGSLEVR